jgi:hypothetical protein
MSIVSFNYIRKNLDDLLQNEIDKLLLTKEYIHSDDYYNLSMNLMEKFKQEGNTSIYKRIDQATDGSVPSTKE